MVKTIENYMELKKKIFGKILLHFTHQKKTKKKKTLMLFTTQKKQYIITLDIYYEKIIT